MGSHAHVIKTNSSGLLNSGAGAMYADMSVIMVPRATYLLHMQCCKCAHVYHI